jgi:TusE/DsrC/DsvC family sulfur relay protein
MRTLPDNLSQVVLTSVTVTVDGHGYLTDPDDWSPEFAALAARSEGITLTPEHMVIVDFMRAYLEDHGIMPDVRFILKFISQRDGVDKSGAKAVLFDLFPYGYVKQACKIAGMKQPRAWSTG